MKIEFKVVSGISKENKEYYAVKMVLNEKVEKVLTFLTKDQYLLLTTSSK